MLGIANRRLMKEIEERELKFFVKKLKKLAKMRGAKNGKAGF